MAVRGSQAGLSDTSDKLVNLPVAACGCRTSDRECRQVVDAVEGTLEALESIAAFRDGVCLQECFPDGVFGVLPEERADGVGVALGCGGPATSTGL
jgi:hypothetical protein